LDTLLARSTKKSQTQGKVVSKSFKPAEIVVSDSSQLDELTSASDVSSRVWKYSSLLILAVATFLRVYHLTLKPLHHDEGVNGFFLTRLIREGIYQYDPGNYHGPTIYYFAFISTFLFGLNTFAIRIVTVIFGVATVWLALCLRRYVGTVGALTAAGLIAISPGAVYLSRYFIHETLVVFFTFGLIVAILKYHEAKPPETPNTTSGFIAIIAAIVLVASSLAAVYRPQHFRIELLFIMVSAIVVIQSLWHYDGERSVYWILAAISLALLFASKETALVSVSVLGLSLASTAIYLRLRKKPEMGARKKKRDGGRKKKQKAEGWGQASLARFGGARHLGLMLFIGFAIFVFVNVLFYSSFFRNAKGVSDSLQTYMIWAKTGKQEHVHGLTQHFKWLVAMESPALMLGLIGAFLSVVRANSRFGLFAAQWGFGLLVAYSIVPYKTPWLALNFIIPLAIAGGYAVNEFYRWNKRDLLFVAVVLAGAVALNGYQTIKLNYFHYDDEDYIYVYGHTYRKFLPMIDEIKRIGQKTELNEEIDIAVFSPDYWPLPWYLRDYPKVGYYSQPSQTSSALVIINVSQEAELLATLPGRYRRVADYPLRPGVVLVLYARNDINLD
jgi:uncharacterized protein (TIGR03663 family)